MDIFENEKNDSYQLLKFIYKKKRTLALGLGIGVLFGFVSYFVLPKKYMSVGIIYPANPYTRDQIISNPQFGYDVEAERLMQLLESRTMMEKVIKKFDLVQYYEIDTLEASWRSSLTLNYIKDVRFERSKYLSVIISAKMRKPELSSEIVNYIITEVSNYRKDIYKQNIGNEINFLKQRVDKQRDKFRQIRNRIYTTKDTSNLDNIIENFMIKSAKEQYYPSDFIDNVAITEWLEKYKVAKSKFHEYEIEYQKAIELAKRPVLKDYIIDKAIPSYKSVSPTVLLIPMLGLLGLVFSFLIIWLLAQMRKIQAEIDK